MIPHQEWLHAPQDEEGHRYGWGICRACGREVQCATWWYDEGPVAHSTGKVEGCEEAKCQDAFPAEIVRMCCNYDYQKTELGRLFQQILEGIDLAHLEGDERGANLWMEHLRELRMSLGCAQ